MISLPNLFSFGRRWRGSEGNLSDSEGGRVAWEMRAWWCFFRDLTLTSPAWLTASPFHSPGTVSHVWHFRVYVFYFLPLKGYKQPLEGRGYVFLTSTELST